MKIARDRWAWWLKEEARILELLHGLDGVVRIVAFDKKKRWLFKAKSEAYLLTELVHGHNMARIIAAGCPQLDDYLKLCFAHRLCEIVSSIHGNKIVHRDLKPDNVILADDGTICVVDFGVAQEVGDYSRLDEGARDYAPIEQIDTAAPRQPVLPQADVFSLGVFFYELLTGRRPYSIYRADDLLTALKAVTPLATRKATWSGGMSKGLVSRVSQAVAKAMRFRPQDRQSSVAELDHDMAPDGLDLSPQEVQEKLKKAYEEATHRLEARPGTPVLRDS